MSEELHDVGPGAIRARDRFVIEGGYATALTDCTIITHTDGHQQAVFMVEIPLDHRFATLFREED